jgi:GNAT superfamily N-acetyltransferase
MDAVFRYDLTDSQRETLTQAYHETWFGEDWDRETVAGILNGSDAIVALCDPETDELLAFAHAISDGTTVALVRDVVVRERCRGQGLGRRLLSELRDHPALADVDSLAVSCPDRLSGFYEACGFEPRDDGTVLVSSEGGGHSSSESRP